MNWSCKVRYKIRIYTRLRASAYIVGHENQFRTLDNSKKLGATKIHRLNCEWGSNFSIREDVKLLDQLCNFIILRDWGEI